jgi:NhaP-type Na+/H+ or K+/H+ antiporter
LFELTAIATTILAFALVSKRLADSFLTPPMVMMAAGTAIYAITGAGSFTKIGNSAIHLLAEITLVLILFSDAARIDVRTLRRDHTVPSRLLLIGMPLTILFGAVAVWMMPFGMSWAEAALVAAILAPTDAALGQSVLSNPNVPMRIRQALNVESGLNDGIAVPVVIVFATIAGLVHGADGVTDHLAFAAKQIVIGPIAGIAVGWAAARLIDTSATRGWTTEACEGPGILATAALAYLLATISGGNGFIAAFTAGLIFGAIIGPRCKFILEFAESEGQTLAMLSFVIFGAVMLPAAIAHVSWTVVLYALLSLTLIRLVPVAIALTGTRLSALTVGFLGWFGPRGLASILFALLIVEKMDTPATTTILTITVTTVAFSIVLHGLTAAPMARRYGKSHSATEAHAENMPVPEIPSRTGMVRF